MRPTIPLATALTGLAFCLGCATMPERPDLVTFKGAPLTLRGHAVAVGDRAPDFTAVAPDLSTKSLGDYRGRVVIISVVPSLDTRVCDAMTRRFNGEAGKLGAKAVVLTLSRDLPFAQKRWCGVADATNLEVLSDFRDNSFGRAYGLEIASGPLTGLLTRAVLVVDQQGIVRYEEIVKDIASEPDYTAAVQAASSLAETGAIQN